MPKSKTGRTKIRQKIRQAINANGKLMVNLQEADIFAAGESVVLTAAIPIALQIAVTQGECLDRIFRAL